MTKATPNSDKCGRSHHRPANAAQHAWQGGFGSARAAHLVNVCKEKQKALKEARELMQDRIDAIDH